MQERTSGQHALDEVVDIAEDNPITFRITSSLSRKRLDLHTLAYGHRELGREPFWAIEDGTTVCVKTWRRLSQGDKDNLLESTASDFRCC